MQSSSSTQRSKAVQELDDVEIVGHRVGQPTNVSTIRCSRVIIKYRPPGVMHLASRRAFSHSAPTPRSFRPRGQPTPTRRGRHPAGLPIGKRVRAQADERLIHRDPSWTETIPSPGGPPPSAGLTGQQLVHAVGGRSGLDASTIWPASSARPGPGHLLGVQRPRTVAVDHQHADPDRAQAQREREHRRTPARTAARANAGHRTAPGRPDRTPGPPGRRTTRPRRDPHRARAATPAPSRRRGRRPLCSRGAGHRPSTRSPHPGATSARSPRRTPDRSPSQRRRQCSPSPPAPSLRDPRASSAGSPLRTPSPRPAAVYV